MLSKRLDRQDEVLTRIHEQTQLTNGRVTKLEVKDAVREGVRVERADELEVRRKERAESLAKYAAYRGWLRPALAGGTVSLLVGAALRFI